MNKVQIVTGFRKKARGKAIIRKGTGKVFYNGLALENINNLFLRLKIQEPLVLVEDKFYKNFDIDVKVVGGGIVGQAYAARICIAKAILAINNDDPELEKVFTDYDRMLLVADVRRKETRKPNDSKARAKRQKSYR